MFKTNYDIISSYSKYFYQLFGFHHEGTLNVRSISVRFIIAIAFIIDVFYFYQDSTLANLKIKTPNKENVKKAITLEKFNAITELYKTSQTAWYTLLDTNFTIGPALQEPDPTRKTLYTFVRNPTIECIAPLTDYAVANKLSNNENLRIAALATRFARFRLRLALLDGLIQCEAQKTVGIARKYQSIIAEMKNKRFYMTLGNSTKEKEGLIITVNSSCATIAKELALVEKELKSLLLGLLDAYGIPRSTHFSGYPQIMQAIKSISPVGLQGIEPDYHYFWTLVSMSPIAPPMMLLLVKPAEATASKEALASYAEKAQLAESQYKQWCSIMQETDMLLCFLL